MMKTPARVATLPEPSPAAAAVPVAARSTIAQQARSCIKDQPGTADAGVSEVSWAAVVECPYCDGENIVAKAGAIRSDRKIMDREVACKHCQSLFLLSESHHQIRFRPVKQPPAAA
jgi:hypothetical protein